MKIGVYSMFIASLEEKLSTFVCFYFHNYKKLQCCDHNHYNHHNQFILDFRKSAQSSVGQSHYGIQLPRKSKKNCMSDDISVWGSRTQGDHHIWERSLTKIFLSDHCIDIIIISLQSLISANVNFLTLKCLILLPGAK